MIRLKAIDKMIKPEAKTAALPLYLRKSSAFPAAKKLIRGCAAASIQGGTSGGGAAGPFARLEEVTSRMNTVLQRSKMFIETNKKIRTEPCKGGIRPERINNMPLLRSFRNFSNHFYKHTAPMELKPKTLLFQQPPNRRTKPERATLSLWESRRGFLGFIP